jgi:signal transduction histidine kinase
MVFEPFRRLHGNDNYSGVGLGLAICRKIVERHGGSIWCESVENQGTTFFFTLPGQRQP